MMKNDEVSVGNCRGLRVQIIHIIHTHKTCVAFLHIRYTHDEDNDLFINVSKYDKLCLTMHNKAI